MAAAKKKKNAKKKAMTTKKAKKVTAKKKVTQKKNVVSKKKKVAPKKAVTKKRTSVKSKKKPVVKKKAASKKKALAKPKKAVAKKKVATKKKALVKKKVSTKKQAVSAKTTKSKKKSSPKSKPVTKNKPTSKKKVAKKVIKKTIVQPTKPKLKIKEDENMTTAVDEFELEIHTTNNDEDYMTDEQLEYFRKILLRWKQQLMQEVDSTVGHMKEEGLSYPDPVDRAAQEEGFNLELRTRDRERKLIKKIESALDSIETGDYGYCEDCGADIGIKRLEARPTATKCIDCKTYQELKEKQAGG